jgi:hypothetical protein
MGKFAQGLVAVAVLAASTMAMADSHVASQKAAPQPATAAAKDTLSGARKAFASGNLTGALNAYRDAVAKNPGDVNAMGEMGNVLFRMGLSVQATQAYFDAASAALKQNNPQVAQALLPIIMRTNPTLGGELQDRLFDMEAQQMDAQMETEMAAEDQAFEKETAAVDQAFEKEMKAAELQWESDAQSPQLPSAAAPQAQKG